MSYFQKLLLAMQIMGLIDGVIKQIDDAPVGTTEIPTPGINNLFRRKLKNVDLLPMTLRVRN